MSKANTNIRNQTINAKIPQVVRLAVLQRDGGRCTHCGAIDTLDFHHIVPPAQSGTTVLANLQILCAPCAALKEKRKTVQ